ncbi:MAG TPA: PIN domain-containing protein [Acidimicrobiia bacterium]|nr:PIN domain-containing protein [Acidimicrobiia bacterium]
MNAVDSSVAIPALAGWHESHELCRPAAASAWIPSQVWLETYSVLTRIPSPYRLAADATAALLVGFFGKKRTLYPSKRLMSDIVEICAAAGIAGGSTYDALIGRIASDHDATLLTLDRRALRTYERLGIDVQLLDSRPDS